MQHKKKKKKKYIYIYIYIFKRPLYHRLVLLTRKRSEKCVMDGSSPRDMHMTYF